MEYSEMLVEARKCFDEARTILTMEKISGEDHTKADNLLKAGTDFKARAAKLQEIQKQAADIEVEAMKGTPDPKVIVPDGSKKFLRFRDFLYNVALAGNVKYRGPIHPALAGLDWRDPNEPSTSKEHTGVAEWQAKATMAEGVGATGGFLVPDEFRAELYAIPAPLESIRGLATIIPMRRRAIRIPSLNQTGTTACQPHWFGGILAYWTEEGGQKQQADATFKQIELVAHKLVCYTRSSDELLDDSAIALDGFLRGPMGFSGAIDWNEEWAFIRGTGAGQPLGVLNAACTLAVPAQANPPNAATFFIDLVNMYEAFLPGSTGRWMFHQRHVSDLFLMNGPAGTPSYLWGGAVAGAAATVLGLPFKFSEKLPLPGVAGSVLLADWKYYLIGDRQMTTIDSTNLERFQYDETSWRAVHRVDGQPWLSAPITLQDGSTQVSPFVVLAAKTT